MFDTTSRYYPIGESTIAGPDNSIIRYKQRRFLPRGSDMTLLAQVTVISGDRLDTIATRTVGDPTQFWRICDANDALNPTELTETAGRILRIAMSSF